MDLTNFKYKANYYALLLLVFVIPLDRKLIAPFTILFILSSFFNASFRLIEWKKLLGFTAIFFLYAFGLFYSNNRSLGEQDLATKLPLLLIPICFFISKINLSSNLFKILKTFIGGCFISIILSFINSLILYYFNRSFNSFFYGNISYYSHPSYIAMMLNMAIVILYYFLFTSDKKKVYKLIFLFLFSLYTLMLASKTGIISLIATHLLALGIYTFKKKKYLAGIIGTITIVAFLFGSYHFSSLLKNRIDELITYEVSDKTQESSTAARFAIWKIALDKIHSEPIKGYGTGSVKSVLVKEYKEKGYLYFAQKELNAHNQFLQTSLAIGILGGLLLFLMIIIPLYSSIKNRHILYLSFLILIIINLLTEAMLERQVGVVFYSVFNSLFFTIYLSKKKLHN